MPRYFCTLHKNITTNDFDLKPLFEDDKLYSLTQNRRYQKILRTLYNVPYIIFLTYSDILTIDFLKVLFWIDSCQTEILPQTTRMMSKCTQKRYN